jgi:uncharacterized protein
MSAGLKHSLDPAAAEWTSAQAEALQAAFAAHPESNVLQDYCALAGFFFALACSPELVKPREWLSEVLGEMEAFGLLEEENRFLGLLMALHNKINLEVLEGEPSLPAGIEVRAKPTANFGPDAPLGRWATGFGAGQIWTEAAWEAYLAKTPDSERQALAEALGGLTAVLGGFAHRKLGEAWRRQIPDAPSLEVAARRTLDMLPDAMRTLAALGRGPEAQRRMRQHTPARSTKVARNAACPCGSGRKFKQCCGAGSRPS